MTATSLGRIGADILHAAPFNERGANALIGVIDDGLDVLHTAFRAGDHSTRIVRLWDQTDPSPPAGADVPFGRLYTSDEINDFIADGKAPPRLANAHGTRVTSIAAGRRAEAAAVDTDAFQGGVAPEAHIIFVKLLNSRAGSGTGAIFGSLQAMDFIVETARELDLPVVLNLSFGSNVGAHDGTAILESHIEDLTELGTKPNICIVKSAGNEQASASQASLELASGELGELVWNSRTIERPSDVIDIWFKSMDRFTFQVFQPEDIAPGATGILSIRNRMVDTTLPNGNHVMLSYDVLNRQNGDARVTIQVFPGQNGEIQGGDWRLAVTAEQVPAGGTLHAWIERSEKRPLKFKEATSAAGRITVPGTARSVITVGAVHNEDGIMRWKSSSAGPTRDGRQKPELAAPGAGVWSALSGTSDRAGNKSGTSFAAPHVAGSIALLMSYRTRMNLPPLNALQIQAALTQNCTGFDGTWRKATGFGVLNIARTIQALDELN